MLPFPDSIKDFLDEKYRLYNRASFIEEDPISIPHLFTRKEDIEISAFLTATISWGQRPVILKNANALVQRMDMTPHDFIMTAGEAERKGLNSFIHRTFNEEDCLYFLGALKNIYQNHGGLEAVFSQGFENGEPDTGNAISRFREIFFELPHLPRTEKHISDPARNSAAKRINILMQELR